MNYGVEKGLDLKYGDYNQVLENDSVDLIILSHVMEHFVNPTGEMNKIIHKLKFGGQMIVEVPSLLNIIKPIAKSNKLPNKKKTISNITSMNEKLFNKMNLEVLTT